MSAGALIGAIGRLAGGGNARGIDETAGAITKLAGAGKQALASITNLASSLSGGLLSPLAAVRDTFQSIGDLVRLFNPALVKQFTLALNDTLAVIGAFAAPILEGMTIYVRAFGDALAGLLPVIAPLGAAIGQYVANFAQGFVPILQAAAPLIQLFADGMAYLIGKLSVGVAFLQGVVAELINTISALFGIQSRFNPKARADGMAVRQTQTSGVRQFADQVFASSVQNAFTRPDQAGEKPEAILQEIRDAIMSGKEAVQAIKTAVQAIAAWFANKGPQNLVAGGAVGAAGVPGGGTDAALAALAAVLRQLGIRVPW